MPGSVATLTACSYTLWSIARISGSLAKITAGTRIAPRSGISHSYSECRLTRLMSMALHVDHRLRHPNVAFARDAERGVGCALDLHRRLVVRHVHRLAPGVAGQERAVEPDGEAAEEHLAGGHLENQGVQPLREQELVVGCLALDGDFLPGRDRCGIDYDRGHGERCLREGLGLRRAEAAHADISAVREVLPARAHRPFLAAWRPGFVLGAARRPHGP